MRLRENLLITLCAAVVALPAWISACGGATAEVRTAYSVEVARCVANERAIVDRQGTTADQDRADLAAERARCDAALAAIGGR